MGAEIVPPLPLSAVVTLTLAMLAEQFVASLPPLLLPQQNLLLLQDMLCAPCAEETTQSGNVYN